MKLVFITHIWEMLCYVLKFIYCTYVHTVQYSIQYSGGIVAVMIYLTTELGTRHRCRDNGTT